MKVILLDNVKKVGRKYEVVDVKDGFGLNYLIPNGLAEHATENALRNLEKRKTKGAELVELKQAELKDALAPLEGKTIAIEAQANEKGHLFAKIGAKEIAEAVSQEVGKAIPETAIEGTIAIKEVGEHEIALSWGGGTIKVLIDVKAK